MLMKFLSSATLHPSMYIAEVEFLVMEFWKKTGESLGTLIS